MGKIERIEAANKAFIESMQQKGYLNYGGNPMISEKETKIWKCY